MVDPSERTLDGALRQLPWHIRVRLFFLNIYITVEGYVAPKRSWKRAVREIEKHR